MYYLASSESVLTACRNEAFLLSMKIVDSYKFAYYLILQFISRLSSCYEVY